MGKSEPKWAETGKVVKFFKRRVRLGRNGKKAKASRKISEVVKNWEKW